MWRCLVLLVIVLPSQADLRIVTKTGCDGHVSTVTDYFKDGSVRSETTGGSVIFDTVHKRLYLLAQRSQGRFSGFSGRISALLQDGRRTVVVESETRDTGEKRQQWGHTARHYVTVRRERTLDALSGDTPWQESTIDSWYLDISAPAGYRNPSAARSISSLSTTNKIPRLQFSERGIKPSGLLIYERTDRIETQVVDLSEASLDRKLVEPTSDYRLLINPNDANVTWDERIQYYWQQFQDWLSGFLSRS